MTVARGTDWSGPDLAEALAWLESAGVRRYIVTDVSKDGSLAGPGAELLDEVLAQTACRVVASGGVASLADLESFVLWCLMVWRAWCLVRRCMWATLVLSRLLRLLVPAKLPVRASPLI